MANAMSPQIAQSYNSFSGADIRAQIGPIPFAEMQAVSYSITREKAPIYTLGSPEPRSFSRNKRGIAGSLVWVNFDRHALLRIIAKMGGKFLANKDDIMPQYFPEDDQATTGAAIYATTLQRQQVVGEPDITQAIGDFDNAQYGGSSLTNWKNAATPWYSDQILPFDITIAGVNEMGAASAMKIFGIEILNEGFGVSVDDAVSEMQCTFVARGIEPWQAVQNPLKSQLQ